MKLPKHIYMYVHLEVEVLGVGVPGRHNPVSEGRTTNGCFLLFFSRNNSIWVLICIHTNNFNQRSRPHIPERTPIMQWMLPVVFFEKHKIPFNQRSRPHISKRTPIPPLRHFLPRWFFRRGIFGRRGVFGRGIFRRGEVDRIGRWRGVFG